MKEIYENVHPLLRPILEIIRKMQIFTKIIAAGLLKISNEFTCSLKLTSSWPASE